MFIKFSSVRFRMLHRAAAKTTPLGRINTRTLQQQKPKMLQLLALVVAIAGASADISSRDASYGTKGGHSTQSRDIFSAAEANRFMFGNTNVDSFGSDSFHSRNKLEEQPGIGVCFIEVPTATLVHNPSQVPAGNGSQPDLSRIRSCCKGYIRNIHNRLLCDPVCSKECHNAICVAPDICTCYPDHVKNAADLCVATCPIGCQNGRCDGSQCRCHDGFTLDAHGKYCLPRCDDNCGGSAIGNCTAPNTCSCKPGYETTPSGSCRQSGNYNPLQNNLYNSQHPHNQNQGYNTNNPYNPNPSQGNPNNPPNQSQGNPNNAYYPNQNQGNPSNPQYTNLSQGNPNNPHYPNQSQGNPNNPHYPNENQGNPNNPRYPNQSQGNPNNPHYPNQNQGNQNNPRYPDQNQGNPNNPHYPNQSQGNPNNPHYPNQSHGNPNHNGQNYPNGQYPNQISYITTDIYGQSNFSSDSLTHSQSNNYSLNQGNQNQNQPGQYPDSNQHNSNQYPDSNHYNPSQYPDSNHYNPSQYPYWQQIPSSQTANEDLVPRCSQPCINGVCVQGNRCSCNPGYELDSSDISGTRCRPRCPGGCQNGVCSAPNFCICDMGYRKEQGVKGGAARCVRRMKRSLLDILL